MEAGMPSLPPSLPSQSPPSPPPLTAIPLRSRRGVQQDLSIQLPGDINIILNDIDSTSFDNRAAATAAALDDGDNLLASYMDMERIDNAMINGDDDDDDDDRFNHMRNNGCSEDAFCGDFINKNQNNSNSNNNNNHDKQNSDAAGEAKKAMSPDKLAELWTVDPKRAKRILANRQSAARSKERKARYIVELEKKVHSLQREATALSVQLSLYERDTAGYTSENTELRRQLESMEQQAQLRDALNDALKQELDRLKVATGEYTSHTDAFIVPVQNIPYNSQPPQAGMESPNSKLLPLYPVDTNMTSPHHFDSNRSKVARVHSLELNMASASQALESPSTKMSNLCLKSNLPSPRQPEDLSKVNSQQLYTFEANRSSLPPSPKIQQFYPTDTSLYVPVDSPKPRMSQSYTIERNMHCLPQPVDSQHGHVPHYPLQPNFSNPQQHVASDSHMLAQTTNQDHLSKVQGFDIGGIGSHLMKLEGPSIFAGEIMGGF